ncbi:MAG: zinc ribbon domain-containing protein [Proteobacteria bacterium]|nr:zinc ribbon domain-containing protein [Pseudomonadota bacterium]
MIYEYRCNDCNAVQEFWMKMSDPAPTECQKCHSQGKLERLISKSSFALKGSGWYTSDYKKASPSTEKKSSDSGSPCNGSGGCGSSESN